MKIKRLASFAEIKLITSAFDVINPYNVVRTFDELHLAYNADIELENFKLMQKDCF